MEVTYKRSLLTSLLLTALYGCGGGGGSSTTGATPSSPSDNNTDTGTNSRSFHYLACIDSNLDGVCNPNENPQRISSISAYGASNLALGSNAGGYPLLLNADSQSRSSSQAAATLVLTAPAGSTEINASTSYLLNERLFNPDTSATPLSLSQAEQQALTDAIAVAVAQYPDANRYQLIAALSNKLTLDRNQLTSTMTLSAEEIAAADSSSQLASKISTTLNSKQSIGWELFQADALDATDQRVNGIVVAGSRALLTSQWHNGLTLVEFGDESSKLLAHTPFAGYAQSGHHPDAYSGASEIAIKKAVTTGSDDQSQLLVLVSRGSKSRPDDDESYGIFALSSALLQQSSELWPYGQGLSPDGVTTPEGVTRFATDGNYTDLALSADKHSVLAYDASALQIKQFTLSGEQSDTLIDLASEKYLSMAVSSTGQLFVSLDAVTGDAVTGSHGPQIRIYNLADLHAAPSTVELSVPADQIYVQNNELTLVDVGGTKVARYQLASGTLTERDLGVTISRSAISPDGSLLAINSSSKIMLLPLGERFKRDTDATLTLTATPRAIALLDNQRLLVSLSGQYGLSVYQLQSQPVNASSQLSNALANLQSNAAELLNHGLPLNAGFYNFSLQASYAPYSTVTIGWSSDIPALSTATESLGQVTRGSEEVSGTLTATASKLFRGQTIQAKLELPVTVRAQPATLSAQTPLTLSGDHLSRSFDTLLASSTGDRLLALGSKGWALFDTQATQPSFLIGQDGTGTATTQTLLSLDGSAYLSSSLVGGVLKGDDEAIVAVDTRYDSQGVATKEGALLRLDLGSSALGDQLADVLETLPLSGTVTGLAQSQDGSLIAIALSKTLADGTVEAWASVRPLADLSQEQILPLDKSYSYLAVSNDGKRLYGYTSASEMNATTGLNETVRRINLFLTDAPKVDGNGLPQASATQRVEANNYRMAYYDQTLYAADYNGNLNLFAADLGSKVSISYPHDASLASYVTGYGSYNGTDTSSNRGRVYSLAIREQAGKRYAYLWHNQRGVDVLDVTLPEKSHTVQWLPISTAYRGAISADGSRAFVAGYSAKVSNSLVSLTLPQ